MEDTLIGIFTSAFQQHFIIFLAQITSATFVESKQFLSLLTGHVSRLV